MNVSNLSTRYKVRTLEEADIKEVVALCETNPLYYQYCPPMISQAGIREDMEALPPGVTEEDKYYVGFYEKDKLIAVLDLITGYPNPETAYIGFFMMDANWQGKEIGTAIIGDVCQYLRTEYPYVRLAYVKGNPQSRRFWEKNHFAPVGEKSMERYDVVIMERQLKSFYL